MTATLTPPEQVTRRVILNEISWETYQRLMEERGEHPQPRYAYDRGTLEIMVTSYEHENVKHVLDMLVELLAAELEIDIEGAASTTFQREDLAQGFEPDASFYVHQASRIRGQTQIDLDTDPPPDLVIEIDISHLRCNSRSSRAWEFQKSGGTTRKQSRYLRWPATHIVHNLSASFSPE